MTGDMRKRLVRLVGVLACVGVAGCAYDNPSQPTRGPIDPRVPTQVTVGAAQGLGTQAGTATVTANVQNANGAPLTDVVVTFTTTRGTIAPAQVSTSANGTASAALTANDTADVTASVGQLLSAHTLVVPTSGPAPVPAPTLPASFLNVSGSATTGVPVVFGVSSSVSNVTWNWSFGDGANDQTSAFSTTHTYNQAGTYTASVSSAATTSSSATIVVTPAAAPPTTPVPTLAGTLTCTPGKSGTAATVCNVSLSFGGAPIGGATVTRVDWDWGDGSLPDNQTTVPVGTHMYAKPGTYTVFATVTAKPVDVDKTTVVHVVVIIL
jgi:PKD repeat protein